MLIILAVPHVSLFSLAVLRDCCNVHDHVTLRSCQQGITSVSVEVASKTARAMARLRHRAAA
jgi:hypothetical protein